MTHTTQTAIRRAATLILVILFVFAQAAAFEAFAADASPNQARAKALSYMEKNTSPALGGEWSVFTLARSGAVDKNDKWVKSYLKDLDKNISSISSRTDAERVTLALTALGIDASAYKGKDLTSKFKAYDAKASMSSKIFGLIALDAKPYSGKRDAYVRGIVAAQQSGGGWNYAGDDRAKADVDVTAMAVCALAVHKDSKAAASAVKKGLTWLKSAQDAKSGGFKSSSGKLSTCSTAQAVIAICAAGKDPAGSSWTVAGKNPLTALLTYYHAKSGYFGETSANKNGMATEQAARALVAYAKGGKSIYDM
ncbi:MAG: hypothetical protein LBJ91_07860 [Clostridiales Family XIII bacterium]|jgi:hypothetical protein|nr:hypothetical protein [Clostridiales Family XIII bacterium]